MCPGLGLLAVISVKEGPAVNMAKCYYLFNLSGRRYATCYITNFALCLFERVCALKDVGNVGWGSG